MRTKLETGFPEQLNLLFGGTGGRGGGGQAYKRRGSRVLFS